MVVLFSHIILVDILSSSLSLFIVQSDRDPIKFASSADSDSLKDKDLLTVHYTRSQKDSSISYGATDQSVSINVSTFIFRAAPEPVLTMYDFIMSTFVPQSNNQTIKISDGQTLDTGAQTQRTSSVASKNKIYVELASVQGWSLQRFLPPSHSNIL